MRSRVELFEQIRRDRRLEELSIRELAERHGVHRRTVRQALAAAVPPPRKAYPPQAAAGDRSVRVGDRRLAARGPGRTAQAAAHRSPGLAAAGRRARRDGVGGDGVALRRPPPGRARPGPPGGVDPADASGRRGGRGRLRRVLRDDRRRLDQVLDVRDAAVALGAGVPRRVRHPGPGGVPRRACAGVRALRRRPGPGALRQPQTRRRPRPERPRPDRVRAVHRAAIALRVRLVLLPTRHRGRAREGRRRGRDRPLPPTPPRPGPEGRLAGGVERADRRRRPGRRRAG